MPIRSPAKRRAYYRKWCEENKDKCKAYAAKYANSAKGQAAFAAKTERRKSQLVGTGRKEYPPKPPDCPSDRYPRLHFANFSIAAHVLVMENHLGRSLLPGESVHHKNGNRHDYRIENLELWSKAQPAGQRIQDKVKWAREILALYGDAA